MTARHVVVDVLLVLGVLLVLISCLGTAAFRSVYDRLHYGSPAALGALLIASAVVVKESFSMVGDKALLVAFILVALAPVVTHAIGRAARTAELGDWTIQPQESIDIEDGERR